MDRTYAGIVPGTLRTGLLTASYQNDITLIGGIPVNDNNIALRTGLRRVFPPWEFRHLRAWAAARLGGSVVAATCGVLVLAFGGKDGTTYAWAALFLGGGALAFAGGYWELAIARSAPPRTGAA
jgi:hypothetical protein